MYVLLGMFLFLVFLSGVLIEAMLRRRRESRAKEWPVTQGAIEDTKGRAGMGRMDPAAIIRYSYSVEGRQYSGHYQRTFLSEDEVGVFLARFPQGTRLLVHFNPAAPQDSQVGDRDLDKPIALADE